MILNPLVIDLCCNDLMRKETFVEIVRMSDPGDVIKHLFNVNRNRDLDGYGTEKVYQPVNKQRVIEDLQKSEQHETSQGSLMSLISNTEMTEDDLDCELCNQFYQLNKDPVEVIVPIMTGSTYRLSMDSPGLFRCSETGIQFRVTQPLTLEYEVDSWSNYTEILQNLAFEYEIIGPLFNIKSSVKANVVSEVYLPHCLCLEGFKGDTSFIKCFHYKDDNVTLETPSRVDPMFAVLENPIFSCLGLIFSSLIRLMRKPCHGMVLLFCKTIIRDNQNHMYILHLYLLPMIRTLVEEVVQEKETCFFKRIPKPPQTKSVLSEKEYRIKGPEIASVEPKDLLFNSCPPEIYSFTEIRLEGEKGTVFHVSILPVDEDVAVWETEVSADEMLNVSSTISRPGIPMPVSSQSDHFVVKHRAYLIRNITEINLVIDELLDLRLLNYEQYESVRIQKTNPEQMRNLYDYIKGLGDDDKDKVYRSLRKHNYSIIKQLEGEVPAEHTKPYSLDYIFKCHIF